MGAFRGGLLVMGLGTVVMAMLLGTLRDVPPSSKASLVRQVEARRASQEIQCVLVPWLRRLGFLAVLVGALLIVVDVIF